MRLTIRYFAILREQRGCNEETIESAAGTPADLLTELADAHSFTLGPGDMRVVVNEEFAEWDTPLAEGDTVAFIPPVAGG